MPKFIEDVKEWLKDERSSVLSEKSLITAVGILGGIGLGAVALPKLKTYAETVYMNFETSTTTTDFETNSDWSGS